MTETRRPPTLTDGSGAPPDLPPDLISTDEGPMRWELRRQIAQLERAIAKFVAENCPYEEVRTSPNRGPGIMTTAQLEQIRDELLVEQSRLHAIVVERGRNRMG